MENVWSAQSSLFLCGAGMALSAGEVGILGINVHEIETLCVELQDFLIVALCKDQVAGFTVVGLDRAFAIPGFVFSIMAAKTTIPFLVAQVVRIGAPMDWTSAISLSTLGVLG